MTNMTDTHSRRYSKPTTINQRMLVGSSRPSGPFFKVSRVGSTTAPQMFPYSVEQGRRLANLAHVSAQSLFETVLAGKSIDFTGKSSGATYRITYQA